jgi:ubiquinone/menaquinone biosynthesis C-methylase UbiE
MFSASAELYDAIYFTFKDYVAEATDIARRIRAVHPEACSILDVGCGTGEHARLLATQHGFSVDGIDINPEFLRLARAKHPTGRFFTADMIDFNIGDRYDAVICMFSSIGYVRTLPALERAFRSFARHVTQTGVVLVEPWFPPEKMESGHQSERSATSGTVRVHRVGTTEIEDRLCRLRFDYTVEELGRVQRITEVHELGLFTEQETLQAFAAAGLAAQHEAKSPSNRGLYVARIAA